MDYNSNHHLSLLQNNKQAPSRELPTLENQHYSKHSSQTQDETKDEDIMSTNFQRFQILEELYSKQSTKVFLMMNHLQGNLLVSKSTEIPESGSSSSMHFTFEIQFYKKLTFAYVTHLVKIQKVVLDAQKCTRFTDFACRRDISFYIQNIPYNSQKEQKLNHLKKVKNIILQVINGLQQIHNLGYVYQDLKPQNIFVSHEGKILIGDFGLVAPIGVIDQSICGTLDYMAPQRLSRKRETISLKPSIDIWSLGILTFELLMGYTPYYCDQDDIDQLLENIFGGYISFDQDYPSYCKKFIFSLLQTNPNKRLKIEEIRQHQFLKGVKEQPLLNMKCMCQKYFSK